MLADATDLLKLLKQASTEAVESTQPTSVTFGSVTSIAPLEILVEQRLSLTEKNLVLTRNVTDFTISVSMEWESEVAGDKEHDHGLEIELGDGGDPSHTHTVDCEMGTENMEHLHEVKGKKELIIHNALEVGEKVVLVRMIGGQKYIVLDRLEVVVADDTE